AGSLERVLELVQRRNRFAATTIEIKKEAAEEATSGGPQHPPALMEVICCLVGQQVREERCCVNHVEGRIRKRKRVRCRQHRPGCSGRFGRSHARTRNSATAP